MRDEQEAALAFQVIRHQRAGFRVQMVGRLVDQQEAVFARKQQREQQPHLLAAGQRAERPVQDLVRKRQPVQLAREPPVFVVRLHVLDHTDCVLARVGDGKREIVARHGGADRAAAGQRALEQPQQRRFAAPVAADQTEPPVGVQPEGNVLKDSVIAALIGKGQIGNFDDRHKNAPPTHEKRCRTTQTASHAQKGAEKGGKDKISAPASGCGKPKRSASPMNPARRAYFILPPQIIY